MTRDELCFLGREIWGPRWQSRVAHSFSINPRTVRRWVSGKAEIPESIASQLHELHESEFGAEEEEEGL